MSSETNRKFFGNRPEEVTPSNASFSAFLRNRHPHDTVYWICSATGINPATVEKWLAEKALPQLRHLGPLLAIYGPAILKAIYPSAPDWLDAAHRAEQLRELEARQAEIEQQMRELRGCAG